MNVPGTDPPPPASPDTGYSPRWFETFLRTVPDERSDAEVAFLREALPVERFPRVLDVCCGEGRHAVRLARAGHRVTAVDRDADVLARAPEASPGNPRYVPADMRELDGLPGPFDAAILLWQSFGQFEPPANDAVLDGLARALRTGGRLVLDLYHRDFFAARQGTRALERAGRRVRETTAMIGRRLAVRLEYQDGSRDEFDWELFTPEELAERSAPSGLRLVESYAGFDRTLPASPDAARFQAVLVKEPLRGPRGAPGT